MGTAWISCLLAAAVAAGATGCRGDADPPVSNTIRFELDFGSGVTLSSLVYLMTGPNGFRRNGTLDLGDQPTVTATFQNLPPGQGYKIQVAGTATDDTDTCRGQATFDVSDSMTATIQIPLTCSGIASVTATINVCPVIDELSALPAEVVVGGSLQLAATAHDSDNGPSPLSATWTASGGVLSNQSTTGATFTCTAPGTFTVSVTISDGSTTDCLDTVAVTVACTAMSAALEGAPRRARTV